MSKFAWSFFKRRIPHTVQIRNKISYEILWAEQMVTPDNLGETRFNERQIIIKRGMTDKLTVVTYLHELLHALSYEYDINLTESQVLACEKFFLYILKNDNIFKGK